MTTDVPQRLALDFEHLVALLMDCANEGGSIDAAVGRIAPPDIPILSEIGWGIYSREALGDGPRSPSEDLGPIGFCLNARQDERRVRIDGEVGERSWVDSKVVLLDETEYQQFGALECRGGPANWQVWMT